MISSALKGVEPSARFCNTVRGAKECFFFYFDLTIVYRQSISFILKKFQNFYFALEPTNMLIQGCRQQYNIVGKKLRYYFFQFSCCNYLDLTLPNKGIYEFLNNLLFYQTVGDGPTVSYVELEIKVSSIFDLAVIQTFQIIILIQNQYKLVNDSVVPYKKIGLHHTLTQLKLILK